MVADVHSGLRTSASSFSFSLGIVLWPRESHLNRRESFTFTNLYTDRSGTDQLTFLINTG